MASIHTLTRAYGWNHLGARRAPCFESVPRSCATLDCQPCKRGKPSCKHISFVHSICGAHYGSNVNRKVGVPKRNQVEQLWLNIKTEVWKFDERPKNVVSGYTTNCSNGLNFASKQIMHKSCPHKLKWRLCFCTPKMGTHEWFLCMNFDCEG